MQSDIYKQCLTMTEQYKNSYEQNKFLGNPTLLNELKNLFSQLDSNEKNEYKKFIKNILHASKPESDKDMRNAAISGVIGAITAPALGAYYAGKVVISNLIAYGFFGGVTGFVAGPEIVGRNLDIDAQRPYLTILNTLGFGVRAVSTMRSYASQQAARNTALLVEEIAEEKSASTEGLRNRSAKRS